MGVRQGSHVHLFHPDASEGRALENCGSLKHPYCGISLMHTGIIFVQIILAFVRTNNELLKCCFLLTRSASEADLLQRLLLLRLFTLDHVWMFSGGKSLSGCRVCRWFLHSVYNDSYCNFGFGILAAHFVLILDAE